MSPDTIISRRALIRAAGLAPVVAVIGCTATVTTDLAKASQYAQVVAQGLNTVISLVGNLAGMSAATVAKYGNYVAQAMALAVSIGSAVSSTSAQTLVVQFEAVVTGALGALASSTGILPPAVIAALKDVAAVLPEIMVIVGLFVKAPVRMAAFASAVAPETALQNLRNFIAANAS